MRSDYKVEVWYNFDQSLYNQFKKETLLQFYPNPNLLTTKLTYDVEMFEESVKYS